MNAQRPAHQATAAGLGDVEFRVLGPLEALVEGEPVALGPPKQRALLAHLLLNANDAVPAERLVDALWPDEPPPTARHAIQVYVSKLRRLLRDARRIEARSRAYVLRAQPDEIDLGRFRQLVADADAALADDDSGGAAELLRIALALWRARPLADLDGEPGVQELVLELEEQRVAAVELRVWSELQAGRSNELIPELEELVAEYPAREKLHADLILALYRSGRRDEALEAYGRAERMLLNELGLEPNMRLKELNAAIRRRDPSLTPEPPELRARRHLPAQPNQFIGRERELGEIVDLIARRQARLITFTGTGGIGKTRLALQAGERLIAHFEDGVWFADLSPLSDPELVAPAIAHVFGVEDSTELAAHLAEKQVLLVVDNFEQVVDAAPALNELHRDAPGLALLVTSRSPLRVAAERTYEVHPLEEHDAVHLLASRARAVARGFDVTDANAREIADICASVDRLPLAIELAGAALKELSPAELRARLGERLRMLVGGPVDVPARQQTMHAAIEWSYELLSKREQRLFARLAIFSGNWTAEAAAEVCGATETVLASLREKGLIRPDGDRNAMLATIREFALEQLTPHARGTLARKHAAYFTRVAEDAAARMLAAGRDPKILEELARDYENFRAALRTAKDGGLAVLLARLVVALTDYWYVRGPHGEARHWVEVALTSPPDDARLDARLLRSLGIFCLQQGDYADAVAAFGRARELFRETEDREMEASALGNLAGAAIYAGQPSQARDRLLESRQIVAELRNELMLARVTNILGVLELQEGRLEEAEGAFEESLLASERIGNREGAELAFLNLGMVALRAGRIKKAAGHFRQGLQLANELQHALQMTDCFVGLAAVAGRRGDLEHAGRLLGAAEAILEGSGAQLEPLFSDLDEETRAQLRAALGDEGAADAIASGRSQPRDEALAAAAQEKGSDPVGV